MVLIYVRVSVISGLSTEFILVSYDAIVFLSTLLRAQPFENPLHLPSSNLDRKSLAITKALTKARNRMKYMIVVWARRVSEEEILKLTCDRNQYTRGRRHRVPVLVG